MTKSKRKAQAQRFSGPELSALLDQVVSELGPAAEISEVNKIRSGGFAGFFCREEYEIVVDATSATPANPATAANPSVPSEPAAHGARRRNRSAAAPTIAAPTAGATVGGEPVAATAETPGFPGDEPIVREPIVRESVEATSVATEPIVREPVGQDAAVRETAAHDAAPYPPVAQEPIEAAPTPLDGSAAPSEVLGGPRPIAEVDQRFLAMLDRRLDETAEVETAQAARHRTVSAALSAAGRPVTLARRPTPRPSMPLTKAELSSEALMADPVAGTAAPRPASHPTIVDTDGTGHEPAVGFWPTLGRARQQLANALPASPTFVAVIGPLSLTTPVIGRLRTALGLVDAQVIVLTDRAEVVSEPNWQLVRSGHQLVDAAQERNGEPTILVIDVPADLPQWMAPLQQRLRLAGVEAFRFAVPGTPTLEQLERYRHGCDVPYLLDLVSRVEPARLVDFVAQHHPVGSVGGAPLTAELLVAMQEQVTRGR
ncbi:MAG: hypothetical protein AAGA65_27310 [Actinomycetota bacterium]